MQKKFFNTQGVGVHELIRSQDHPQYATAEINKHVAPSRSTEKAESVVKKGSTSCKLLGRDCCR